MTQLDAIARNKARSKPDCRIENQEAGCSRNVCTQTVPVAVILRGVEQVCCLKSAEGPQEDCRTLPSNMNSVQLAFEAEGGHNHMCCSELSRAVSAYHSHNPSGSRSYKKKVVRLYEGMKGLSHGWTRMGQ